MTNHYPEARKACWNFSGIYANSRQACLNAIEYLKKFGFTGAQAYAILGMPIYEYECRAHGVFEELRSMGESQLPAPCPTCQEGARRIVSVPALACISRSEVVARDRNHKSCHEPRVSKLASGDRPPSGDSTPERQKAQVYHGPRPWVIEHA